MVTIYCDGSLAKGRGGWGAVLIYNGFILDLQGEAQNVTHNEMELTAAIRAFEALKKSNLKIEVFSDSQYLIMGMNEWRHSWRIWRGKLFSSAQSKWIKNHELWLQLFEWNNRHDITWTWVRGHNGDIWNEYVDGLATGRIQALPRRTLENT